MTETKHIYFYELAEKQISEEHPIQCVCGRLCTGFHEMTCRKFKRAVENRTKKLEKQYLKNKTLD